MNADLLRTVFERFIQQLGTAPDGDTLEIALSADKGTAVTAIRRSFRTVRRTIRVQDFDAKFPDGDIVDRLRDLYRSMHRELFPLPLPPFRIATRGPRRLVAREVRL